MEFLIPLLKGIVPPVLVALALISAGGSRLLPAAIGLGLTMAFVLLEDWPTLPHHLWSSPNGTQWLYWCVIAAMLVSLLELWRCLPARVALVLGLAVAGASVWFVIQRIAVREGMGWNLLHVGCGGLVVAGLALGGRRLISRAASSPFLPAFIVMILTVDAVVLTTGGSALLGQMCGACAAAVGASIATSLWCKPFTMAVADGTWFGIVHGLFLLAGANLAFDPSWLAILLALVAPALPLALPKSFAKERPKRWMLVAILLAGLPAATAIVLTIENA